MLLRPFLRFGRARENRCRTSADGNTKASCNRGISLFFKDRRGDVALMFGLLLFTLLFFIGAAVDYSRWLNARDQTFAAIDAAVLAAGRALQTGASQEEAISVAQKYYNENIRSRLAVESDTIAFEITNNGTTVGAKGSAYIRTPFMALATVNNLALIVANEAPAATTQRDAFANVNREVSIMLDTSGSMCNPCSKRDDMKAAAKDLVEILMKNNDKTPYWAKVAIVPFAGDVRPPVSLLANITDPLSPDYREVRFSSSRSRRGSADEGYSIFYPQTKCVAERMGNDKFSNEAPGPGRYIPYVYNEDDACSIRTENTVAPLSATKSNVLAAIDRLRTNGSTAGHIGTAWAYYMLSPQWNSVLPAESAAQPFETKNVKKIAILMTDGEYNSEHDKDGLPLGLRGSGSSANGNSSSGQAMAMCNQMKHDGIEVYTVGFDIEDNRNALNTLENCASDKSKNYTVETGEQLKQAFRDIAIRLTELHISK